MDKLKIKGNQSCKEVGEHSKQRGEHMQRREVHTPGGVEFGIFKKATQKENYCFLIHPELCE